MQRVGMALAIAIVAGLACMPSDPPSALRIDEAQLFLGSTSPDERYASTGFRVSLPDVWRSRRVLRATEGWYRLEVDLAEAPSRPLAIYLPFAFPKPAGLWLNETRLALADDGIAFASAPLWRAGRNVIDLYLQTTARQLAALAPVTVGPSGPLEARAERARFLQVVPGAVVGSTALLIAFLLLAALGAAPGWRAYRLQSLGLAFLSIPLLANAGLVDTLSVFSPWTSSVAVAIGAVCLVAGLRMLLDEPYRGRAAITSSTLALLALACFGVPDRFFMTATIVFLAASFLAFVPGIRLALRLQRSRGNPIGRLPVAALLLGVSLIAVHDLASILPGGELLAGVWLNVHIITLIILFSLLSLLLVVRAETREAEQLRHDLEVRVAQRERELGASYARLSALESERAVSAERDRVMQEIHDGVGGQLVSTLALLEAGPSPSRDVALAVREALDDLRLLVDSLDPTVDDLAASLGMLRMRLEPRLTPGGIQLDWQVGDLPAVEGLGSGRCLHVMRVAQEAISNAIAHAAPSRIVLRTGPEERDGEPGVFVEVEDDGRGMPPEVGGGRGLRHMRARAASLGGILEVCPGEVGTRVRLWLPCRAPVGVADDDGAPEPASGGSPERGVPGEARSS